MTPSLAEKVARATALLRRASEERGPIALATSLSAEDMVLTDMIARERLPIAIFTLDTGRLHPETVSMVDTVRAHFGIEIDVFRPDPEAVASYVRSNGANAYYESVDLRKSCCHIRKVEPLNRALAGKKGWVTGQRREQSVTRDELEESEFDAARAIAKFNPLADWSWADVLAYVKAHKVPVNPLHARGYVSIGCEPCTRAIRKGEDPRAGRWWWEQSENKECGLHVEAEQAALTPLP